MNGVYKFALGATAVLCLIIIVAALVRDQRGGAAGFDEPLPVLRQVVDRDAQQPDGPVAPAAAKQPEPWRVVQFGKPSPRLARADPAAPVHRLAQRHRSRGDDYFEPRAADASGRTHTVRKRETLSGIAKRYYGSSAKWRLIADANKAKLGGDPNRISVGMKLRIPPQQ